MNVDTHPSTHPPLPPTTEDDRLSWLRLLRSRRVGIATFYRLLSEHQTAQAALRALPEIAAAAGVSKYTPCPTGVVEAELRTGAQSGARLIAITDPEYPQSLRDIPDPPPLVWVRGDIGVLNRPMVAMVGARNASSLGGRVARAMARDLGEAGYVVVSGLARGIDTAAHLATVDTGTIAVMAGGVDVLYPSENPGLAGDIVKSGLLVSECAMGVTPQARHFPPRNRIISGLAQGVVIVEAAAKSGSIITARNALDQGREVLAVPGHPFDARASGCNMLIRDGARLVRNAADVIEALPKRDDAQNDARDATDKDSRQADLPLASAPARRTLAQTADLHTQILDRLGPSPMAEDQLIRDLQAEARDVSSVLIDLELEGQIQRRSGGLLARIA